LTIGSAYRTIGPTALKRGDPMDDVGLGGALFAFAGVSLYVLIPALAIGLGLRLAGLGRPRPEAILRKRLARGEITPAEYDSAMSALGR
jgi:uncharacterized membrane protein